MRTGVIFDLDGTLVDSLAGIAASLNRSMEKHGFTLHDKVAVRGFIGDGVRMLVTRALGELATAELVESLLTDFVAHYALTWPEGTRPYTGIPELLTDLKSADTTLAVLSNKPHDFTTEIVERLFPGLFDFALGQREDLPHKPDPSGALEICEKLRLDPAHTWLVGDSVIDLETAKRAGMKSVAVTWGYHDADRLGAADHIVSDLPSLTRLLSRP